MLVNGIEPLTSTLSEWRSNLLNYTSIFWVSHRRPHGQHRTTRWNLVSNTRLTNLRVAVFFLSHLHHLIALLLKSYTRAINPSFLGGITLQSVPVLGWLDLSSGSGAYGNRTRHLRYAKPTSPHCDLYPKKEFSIQIKIPKLYCMRQSSLWTLLSLKHHHSLIFEILGFSTR